MLRTIISATANFGPCFRPNIWDLAVLPLILAILWLFAFGGSQMTAPYNIGDSLPISLDPDVLPYYLLRSFLRMIVGLFISLLFTMIYATLAAKNRYAEKIMIPILDVLQSIPILGFLSITVTGFIALFPGNLIGVECASIFSIFTSQAWNMTFSFYALLRTVPYDLQEVATMFNLSTWQRFWRLDLPFATPGLIWNMMMSVSGGWFFVVASEAITVNSQIITLPGIGSYIALAIAQQNLVAIGYAIFTMFIGIIVYDLLFFRPLIAWTDKFKFESILDKEIPTSQLLNILQRTRFLRIFNAMFVLIWEWSLPIFRKRTDNIGKSKENRIFWFDRLWILFLLMISIFSIYHVCEYIQDKVGFDEILHVFMLGLITAIRVVVLIVIAAMIWVPIGVWIGFRLRLSQTVRPIVQFMAAFPANLMFPVVVILILRFDANVEIWISPLMILGTQWYILFNIISGAILIPNDLRAVADNLGLKGWLRWKRLILPGIFPSFVTGAITASGGSWNASIVSEMVSWGNTTLMATGIGSYIADNTRNGDFPRIALGVAVMCCYVMLFNRQIWRRMYRLSEERLRIN
ncbi:MAG: ABC transporter permease subunit [Rhodospirillaceae bacterium]|nr:ABC transporter permease subunit [Rhodospirillaceae bacterium]